MRVLSLMVPLLVAPVGGAQEDPGPAKITCRTCENRGGRDCSRHRNGLLELEREVVRCSVATECSRCGGALIVDCKICRNVAVENAAEVRRQTARDWLAERREAVDEYTGGKGIMHCETAHVDLTFSFRGATVDKTKLDGHRLMHLYAQRIEQLRNEFMQLLELADSDFPDEQPEAGVSARLHVYMFEELWDHRKIAPRATGIGAGSAGVKLMGVSLVYSMYRDGRVLPDDEAVHRSIVHNVTHLLLSSMKPTMWLGNRKHGWIDEGLAHYFEYRVDGHCTNFCYEEVGISPGAGFKGGKWRVALRKQLEAGALRKFTELYQKNSDQLDFEAHAHAFAWVEFLIAVHGGRKFADFVRWVKRTVPTREALRRVYGFGPLEFDQPFAAWVRETYPMRAR